jgi:hypothetical protein
MADRFSAEIWSQDRQALVFRWSSTAVPSARWTFCVTLEALAEVCPSESFNPFQAFERTRAAIYCAAAMKISTGDSADQHLLSAEDIRAAQHILSRHDSRGFHGNVVAS